ncbi:hypothetical protein [Rugosimonospora africana]|uniref:Uncharacterized protein n=1 Tax=Rugosimonospora africana TaxID=556532 RepID=A0A8J3QMF7_9ACTN|nr:hypothetical protein [Rugosimonospora africana]GIH12380.1 hypothetical protein Raf01_05520 [Rugosimonospora africana]
MPARYGGARAAVVAAKNALWVRLKEDPTLASLGVPTPPRGVARTGALVHDEPMRVLRLASVPLFGAAVLTGVVLIGSPAVSAPNDSSLTLAPNHGLPTAVFVAQYRVQPSGTQQGPRLGCPVVQFTWDGLPLGAPQRSARRNGTTACVASIRARPPARARAAGAHRVAVPGTLGRPAQVATYTIQGAVSPTPNAGRPTPTHAATSVAQEPTEPALFAPSSLGGQVVPLNNGAPSAQTAPLKTSGSIGPWIMILGAVLVVGGVGMLGMLVYRGRRRRPDPRVDPEFGFDPEVGGFYD